MEIDARIASLAARQYGLITKSRARRAGFSPKAVRHRVSTGRWVQVRPGVYAIAGTPPSWHQAVLAAVLASGDAAFASHATAARLWELPLPSIHEIEITIPRERRVRLPGVRAHQTGIFHELDFGELHGIPVARPARLLVDLSSRLSDADLGKAIDEGLRRGVLSLNAIQACAKRFDIAPGRSPSRLRRVLGNRIPGYDPGDSDLETEILEAILRANLPPPVRRYPLSVGGRRFVIDLAYPDLKTAIEVDGFDVHGTRSAFDADRERQNALVVARWRVLRFTSNSTPQEIADTVAAACCELRAPRRGAK
jgi:hypothetical protein